MQVINDIYNIPTKALNTSVALGNFDGVHLGHQKVITSAIKKANQLKVPSAVLTFEPHPVSVLRKDVPHFRLSNTCDKILLLKEIGVDFLFVINFNLEFAKIPAIDFIHKILIDNLQVSHVATGYDFIFGYKKGGNSALLEQEAYNNDFSYKALKPVGDGQHIYSSTLVRNNLKNAKLDDVKEILGRNHFISGTVIKGAKLGRTIGFATANIDLKDLIRPKFGVYLVKVSIEGYKQKFDAIANIGNKPTVEGKKELLEVHIFDFNDDIYGKNINVELLKFIRDEKRFKNIDNLKRQIIMDIQQVKEVC